MSGFIAQIKTKYYFFNYLGGAVGGAPSLHATDFMSLSWNDYH